MQRKSELHDKHSNHIFIQITAVDDLNIAPIGQEHTCKEIVIPENSTLERPTSEESTKYALDAIAFFSFFQLQEQSLGRPQRALALCWSKRLPAKPPLLGAVKALPL